MDILVIDGVALPTPNEYKVQLSDLASVISSSLNGKSKNQKPPEAY